MRFVGQIFNSCLQQFGPSSEVFGFQCCVHASGVCFVQYLSMAVGAPHCRFAMVMVEKETVYSQSLGVCNAVDCVRRCIQVPQGGLEACIGDGGGVGGGGGAVSRNTQLRDVIWF